MSGEAKPDNGEDKPTSGASLHPSGGETKATEGKQPADTSANPAEKAAENPVADKKAAEDEKPADTSANPAEKAAENPVADAKKIAGEKAGENAEIKTAEKSKHPEKLDPLAEIERQVEAELAAKKAKDSGVEVPPSAEDVHKSIEAELNAELEAAAAARRTPKETEKKTVEAGTDSKATASKGAEKDGKPAVGKNKPAAGKGKPGAAKSKPGTGKGKPKGAKDKAEGGKAVSRKSGGALAKRRPASAKTPEQEAEEARNKQIASKQAEITQQMKRKQLIVYGVITLLTAVIGYVILGGDSKPAAVSSPPPQQRPAAAPKATQNASKDAPTPAAQEADSLPKPAAATNYKVKRVLRALEKKAGTKLRSQDYIGAISVYRDATTATPELKADCDKRIAFIVENNLEGSDPLPLMAKWDALKDQARVHIASEKPEDLLVAIGLFKAFGEEHPLFAMKATENAGKLGQHYFKVTGEFPK